MKQLYGFFMALLLVLAAMGIFAQNGPGRKVINSHGLPFTETWDQGTFTFNEWSIAPANTNWTISTNFGDPCPSADFTSNPVQEVYSLSLETPLLTSEPYPCAKIWCDFDYKIVNQNSTGREKLLVDFFSEGEWINRAWLLNTEDKDWTHKHVYITGGGDTAFRVRFRAEGASTADILHWYVDNIKIYVTCNPPVDVALQDIADRQVSLTWNPPACGPVGPASEWYHWDTGINGDALGTCAQCPIDVAARWDASQIEALDGGAVTKIAFFPASSGTATFRLRVWQGPEAASLVVDQPLQSVVYGEWNIVDILNPVAIDITQDLWIGYNWVMIGGYPVGTDEGPAVAGYGDMTNISGEWESLYLTTGLNYNWNIQGYIESLGNGPASDSGTLIGYNLFRSDDNKISYNKLNVSLIADTSYTDHVPVYKDYCYYVSSVFQTNGSATSVSDSSNVVCADVLTFIDNADDRRIAINPNPARENVTVTCDVPITGIELFSNTGQQVFARQDVNEKNIVVNVSALKPGLYLFRITTGREISITKVTVAR